MGSYWIGKVGTGASERVHQMVIGTSLTPRSIAGLGAGGDDRIMGAETVVNNELAEEVLS